MRRIHVAATGWLPTRRVPPTVPAPPTVDELDDRFLDAVYDPGRSNEGPRLRRRGPGQRAQLGTGAAQGGVSRIGSGDLRREDPLECHRGRRDDRCRRRIGERDLDHPRRRVQLPARSECKHCVATILTARRQASPAAGSPGCPAAADWRRRPRRPRPRPDGVDDAGARPDSPCSSRSSTPRPPATSTDTGPRVTVRPMRRGKDGQWIKTGASWRDIASPARATLSDVDPLQRAAVRSLMASGPPDLSYSNIQTVPLDQFGPDLWYQLERAVEVGVELIGEHPDDVVELSAARATPSVDLTADDTGDRHPRPPRSPSTASRSCSSTRAAAASRQPAPRPVDAGRRPARPRRPRRSAAPDRRPARRHPSRSPSPPTTSTSCSTSTSRRWPATPRSRSSDGSVTITTSRFDGIVLTRRAHRPRRRHPALVGPLPTRRADRRPSPARPRRPRPRSRRREAAAIDALELPDPPAARARRRRTARPATSPCRARRSVTLLDRGGPVARGEGPASTVEVAGDHPTLREATDDPLISLTVTDGDDDAATATTGSTSTSR